MTYKMWNNQGWGDSISWFTVPNSDGVGKMHGHMKRRPKVGDVIQCQTKSGKTAMFVVTAGDYMLDPPDQFFVDVQFEGYVDE